MWLEILIQPKTKNTRMTKLSEVGWEKEVESSVLKMKTDHNVQTSSLEENPLVEEEVSFKLYKCLSSSTATLKGL